MSSSTDRIEKTTVLRAPLERVWSAISDSAQFGTWFGAQIDGPFEPGRELDCRIVPTRMDPEVAKAQEACAGVEFQMWVEAVEPMRRLAFRWSPLPEPPPEGSKPEVTTLVTFRLEEVEGGTRLTITDEGFDQLPPEQRAHVFASNEEGWTIQLTLVEKYLVGLASDAPA